MNTFFHKFEVRWSDLDANMHLANTAYVAYCAQTRMAFMNKHRIGMRELSKWGIGPVILHERYSFFKEMYMGQEVIVSLELDGISDDGGIYRFIHKFYLPDGTHCATAEATGVWIDMRARKSTIPPLEMVEVIHQVKTFKTKVLTKEDIKALPFPNESIDPAEFK